MRCITFNELCRKHQVEHVDLVVIDAEGYDFEIIKTIDFEQYRPLAIVYEHVHLSLRDRIKCFSYLGSNRYDTLEDGIDTLALLDDARKRYPELGQIWRALKQPAHS